MAVRGKSKNAGSAIKHANKRFSKLQKRGKIKRLSKTRSDLLKKLNRGAPTTGVPSHVLKSRARNFGDRAVLSRSFDNDQDDGVEDMIEDTDDDDDVEGGHAFMQSALNVPDYEKRTRVFDSYDNSGAAVKNMLPIKGRDGIIPVSIPVSEVETGSDDDHQDSDKQPTVAIKVPQDDEPCSAVKLLVRRQKMLADLKAKIAQLASAIIENPHENINSLKQLRLMLDDDKPLTFVTCQKFVIISLLEVFKDIIPGYRIRPMTESESQQKVKRDTQHLQDYENGLLLNYKAYLMKLETATRALGKRRKGGMKSFNRGRATDEQHTTGNGHADDSQLPFKTEEKLAELAVRCLCDLLVAHPHFNFRSNIIVTLVPFTCSENSAVSELCCKTLKSVYRKDKLGDVSIEAVKQTVKLLKSKAFTVPPRVLDTFLALKLNAVKSEDDAANSAKKVKDRNGRAAARVPKLSKRELKRKKKMAKLETELLETAGEESKQKKIGFQTEILKQVFLTYFRILKTAPGSILLSAVLEGLAKFSHLINVEFFDDLVAVLNGLIESGNLDYRQCLHCIQTVMTILSGQGEALNIDPMRFYTHLYRNLFALHVGASSDDLPIALSCLDTMINTRRKKVSYQRVVAFTKRLLTLSLQLRHDGAIGVLALARSFMQNHKRVDVLLDTDTSQTAGVHLPELDEPEYCNASSTALWELSYLRNHYHPVVRKLGIHLGIGCPVLGDGQLTQDLSRRSAVELYNDYASNDEFKPPLPKPVRKPISRQKAKALLYNWSALDREVRASMKSAENMEIANDEFVIRK